MVLYPQHLSPNAIPCDVALISEANLRRLDPVDLVIARWPY